MVRRARFLGVLVAAGLGVAVGCGESSEVVGNACSLQNACYVTSGGCRIDPNATCVFGSWQCGVGGVLASGCAGDGGVVPPVEAGATDASTVCTLGLTKAAVPCTDTSTCAPYGAVCAFPMGPNAAGECRCAALDGGTEPDSGAQGDSGGGCPEGLPLHCADVSDCLVCTDGAWTCVACKTSDASTGTSCQSTACGPGQACVQTTSCTATGGCLPNGITCPAGTQQDGMCCCEQWTCEDLPASCGGSVNCNCASSLCPSGDQCGVSSTSDNTLLCGFYPRSHPSGPQA